ASFCARAAVIFVVRASRNSAASLFRRRRPTGLTTCARWRNPAAREPLAVREPELVFDESVSLVGVLPPPLCGLKRSLAATTALNVVRASTGRRPFLGRRAGAKAEGP